MSKYHNTPLAGRERNYQINLNRGLYNKAKEDRWLLDLSLFIWISYEYGHKFFTPDRIKEIAKKTKYSESSIRRKLDILAKNGLISKPNQENNETYVVASNRKIWHKYGSHLEAHLYVSYSICKKGIHAIYDHLRLLPLISDLEKQLRKIAKNEHLISLKTRSQTANKSITQKEVKRVQKAIDKGFDFNANCILTISNETIAEKLGVSVPTAIYLKKVLAKTKGYKVERRYKILLENVTYEEYSALRGGLWKDAGLPEYFLWDEKSKVIYCDTSSQFYLPKREVSKKSKFLSQAKIYLSGGRNLDFYQSEYFFTTITKIREYVLAEKAA